MCGQKDITCMFKVKVALIEIEFCQIDDIVIELQLIALSIIMDHYCNYMTCDGFMPCVPPCHHHHGEVSQQ